jgi:hypothetical protein
MFVCSYNVIKGGGVNITIKFTEFLLKKGEKIYLLYPNNSYYKNEIRLLENYPNFRPIKFYVIFNFIFFKPFINYLFLPILVFYLKPSKIFNFGNIAFPSTIPQFLLMHNAFVIAERELLLKFDFKQYIYLNLMSKYIKYNLKFANVIGVQTKTIFNKLKSFNINFNLILIPNGISLLSFNDNNRKETNGINLLFLSKYYVHKNFEILFKLSDKLRKENIKIFITLDKSIKQDNKFLNLVLNKKIDDVIVNIGFIKQDELPKVYNQVDGLFLPTLLESFSTTYLESFYFKKPIFTSNRDFAIEICEDAAFYFNPLDENDIINTITNAFNNPDLIDNKINLGLNKLSNFEIQNNIFDKIFTSI